MSDKLVETEERYPQSSLRDLYCVFFRHKWKMILFFLAVIVTVVVGTFSSAEIYRSEAKLLVRLGRESVALDPTATTGEIVPIAQTREREINTELAILESQEIAEKVVDSIGPGVLLRRPDEEPSMEGAPRETVREVRRQVRAPAKGLRNLFEQLDLVTSLSDRDSAVGMVMNNLEVATEADNSTISLAYESQSPILAQDVLTKLIESYLERHIAVHQTPGSYEFFIEQSDHLRGRLAELEGELRNVKTEAGISSFEEQQAVILGRIGVLDSAIDTTDAALASSGARVETLQKTLAAIPETVVTTTIVGFPNAAADGMRGRLYELQLMEQDLASKFREGDRQVQDVRQQIAAAQALLEQEEPERTQFTKALNAIHQEVNSALLTEQANLSSLQAGVEALKGKLVDARAELKALDDGAVRITALTREIEIQEANYRKYSENLEQARIDDALESQRISNINVIQPATFPIAPVRPRKALNLFFGLLLSVLGGIGLAFFCEFVDHSIKTPEDAEKRLRLPTLACIPRVRSNMVCRKAKWNVPAGVRGHYEAFKEQLLLNGKGSSKTLRVLAIAGCHRREGVSTVAANLAATLAQLGDGNVLLVDADIAHPSVNDIFNTRLEPGLVDALANDQTNGDTILASPIRNLDILAAGTANGNLSEIFSSDGLRRLFDSMKKDYRFVVVDLPAVNEASWAIRLASLCDGVGLVVEAERSRWEVVDRARERLVRSNANVLGVVLNKRRLHIPEWLYRTL